MNYQQAIEWLNTQVPQGMALLHPGQRGLDRTRDLLIALGSPQNKIPMIHIAGTSGKGSTATLIASVLTAHGFKIGLSVSPYIFDVRERMQINGQLPAEVVVAGALTTVRGVVEQLDDTPTYFETVTAVAYLLFAQQGCDYAVIETGMGGTYDATNVIDRPDKITVITRIGLDHMRLLGSTLPEIAGQKVGIVQTGNRVFAYKQSDEINHVLEQRCQIVEASLEWLDVDQAQTITVSLNGTDFDYAVGSGTRHIHLRLIGRHQAENATLAFRAVEEVAGHDGWDMDWDAIDQMLAMLSIPARFDSQTVGSNQIILDGAHNPQKMAAFLAALGEAWPAVKPVFIVGFKEGKQFQAMLEQIVPRASEILLTDFSTAQDSPIRSITQTEIGELMRVFPHIVHIRKPADALRRALLVGSPVVVTGSLYLCASMYSVLAAYKEGAPR